MNMMPAMDVATSQEVSGGNMVGTNIAPVLAPVLVPVPAQPGWPTETDMIVNPVTKRIGLMSQSYLLRDIIHKTFDKIRASLLFHDAFPNAHDTPTLISEFLVSAAAESGGTGSMDVHARLLADAEYMAQMHTLVSFPTLDIALLTIS